MERLEVNGRVYQPWQEAIEREVVLAGVQRGSAVPQIGARKPSAFSAERQFEYLRDAGARIAGVIVRERRAICGVD